MGASLPFWGEKKEKRKYIYIYSGAQGACILLSLIRWLWYRIHRDGKEVYLRDGNRIINIYINMICRKKKLNYIYK